MNITCLTCSYKWESRKYSPKACPMCKRYIKYSGTSGNYVPHPSNFSKVDGSETVSLDTEGLTREPYED